MLKNIKFTRGKKSDERVCVAAGLLIPGAFETFFKQTFHIKVLAPHENFVN